MLDADLVEALSPYPAFRHFFRHAYGVVLRWDKIEHKAAAATDVGYRFAAAVAIFIGFLDALARSDQERKT